MVKDKPLISILICNYNYSKYIVEALDSATKQTYQNIEIVIIDDGSQDDSVKVIKRYIQNHPNKNIYLHTEDKNQGVCYARNALIELAKGEYFIFLDSDNTIPPEYIFNFYEAAVKNNADVVYGDLRIINAENNETTNFPEYNPQELLLNNYIDVCSLVKKDSIHNHRFDISLNRKSHEDYDFWLGLSLEGLKFVKISNTQLNYRKRIGTRNGNERLLGNGILRFIEVWKQIIDKYQQLYPDKISKDILYKQLKYQIDVMTHVESDIRSYSANKQKEFTEKLNVKTAHIKEQDKIIKEQERVIKEQGKTINNIVNSKRYKLATKLSQPALIIKQAKDRIKH